MTKGFLYCAVVLVLAMCGIAPAIAQFPPPPPLPTPPAEAQPVPGPAKGRKAPAPPGPPIVGNWSGQLTQVGSQLVEIITKGAVDKGGRCPHGTITVARAGNDLALFWFGSIEANTIVAYGTLSKK
jgi:hypothetical protein